MKASPKLQTVQLFVPGTPRPQPRPRFAKGRVVSTADPLAARWTKACEFAASMTISHLGGAGMIPHYLGAKKEPLKVELFFMFPAQRRDKDRYGKPHTRTPDADNLAKLVLDAFVRKGLVPGDDSRVCELYVKKEWCRVADAGCLAIITPVRATGAVTGAVPEAQSGFGDLHADWLKDDGSQTA